mmetsp:Transcript_9550/g.22461  ORF Transcript_9550/g.22461 Transcript_9550/m.22461 type:complete len:319 (-) Transcript_9550:137-1093(-)
MPGAGKKSPIESAVTKYAAAGIFLISGIKLRTAEARAALKQRKAVVWGVASTLFLTCFLGVFINSRIPLPVPEFSLGLGVFLCMPCTINCGGALAVQSGGDFAMALLLTVLCSTLGVFTVPLLMERLLDFGVGVTLPVGEMIKKLFFMVLIPLALGKAMASSSQAAQATATKFDKPLTYLSSSLIILVPWIEVSRSAARGVFDAVSMGDMGALTALYGFIHITFFAANWAGSKVLGLSSETSKAVVFVASGKALPLALTVMSLLPAGVGDKGLLAVPAIWGWSMQILMDSPTAAAWRRRTHSILAGLPRDQDLDGQRG